MVMNVKSETGMAVPVVQISQEEPLKTYVPAGQGPHEVRSLLLSVPVETRSHSLVSHLAGRSQTWLTLDTITDRVVVC